MPSSLGFISNAGERIYPLVSKLTMCNGLQLAPLVVIRFWEPLNKILTACRQLVFFIIYPLVSKLTRIYYKKSPTTLWLRILLRSVADSNRCNWFCRPAPSHSANRPGFLCITNLCKLIHFCQSIFQFPFITNNNPLNTKNILLCLYDPIKH